MTYLINEHLLTEIDHARERIDARRLNDCVGLMHDDLTRQVIQTSPNLDRDNQVRAKEVIINFRNAWAYGTESYQAGFDLSFLQDLAGIIEPQICGEDKTHAPLRNQMVKLKVNGDVYLPPADRTRITESLDRMVKALDQNPLHPVEEALFYNLHLSRIQAFDNGNKRLASLVMNLNLLKQGYFPISLSEKDRGLYRQYLAGAILGFRDKQANANSPTDPFILIDQRQAQFYEFLARRELTELKCADDRLGGLHSYTVKFDPRDKGVLYTVKRRVQSWFEKQKLPYQERLIVDRKEMEITGDIPLNVLNHILGEVKNLNKYELVDNGRHTTRQNL